MEDNMVSRIVSGGALAALAGAAMLVVSSGPSSAFTLNAPSLQGPIASADIQQVWWDRWGRWHPNYPYYYRPYYYGWYRPYYGYYRPYLHCWWTAWGRRCRWY
jgi:hypothetical protein